MHLLKPSLPARAPCADLSDLEDFRPKEGLHRARVRTYVKLNVGNTGLSLGLLYNKEFQKGTRLQIILRTHVRMLRNADNMTRDLMTQSPESRLTQLNSQYCEKNVKCISHGRRHQFCACLVC